MKRLIPPFISQKYVEKINSGNLSGTVLSVDITGFTSMTEKLMKRGSEGAEILSYILDEVFDNIVETIYKMDGFVSSFAGDACNAIFFGDQSIENACVAAERIRDFSKKKNGYETKFGVFNVTLKIGLSYGMVEWEILDAGKSKTYYFTGEAIRNSFDSQKKSKAGDIVLDKRIYSHLKNLYTNLKNVNLLEMEKDFYILDECNFCFINENITEAKKIEIDCSLEFIPEKASEKYHRGEFREVLPVFLLFSDFPDKNELNKFIKYILSRADLFGGFLSGLDFGDKGNTALVIFGAPVMLDNIWNRAVLFSRSLVELYGEKVKIGISYGTAFSGIVGSELQCTYTCLGDEINLAQRISTSARAGQIIVTEKVMKKTHKYFNYRDLGDLRVKGKESNTHIFLFINIKNDRWNIDSTKPMVGRDFELEKIKNNVEKIFERKKPGIIYISGGIGVGKTRLVVDFIKNFEDDMEVFLFKPDLVVKKNLGVLELFFKDFFKIDDRDSESEKKEKFNKIYKSFIDESSRYDEKELSRISSIIGSVIDIYWENSVFDKIEPGEKVETVKKACASFIKSRKLPILCVLEDYDSFDSSSLDVFDLIVKSSEKKEFVILALTRKETDYRRIDTGENCIINEMTLTPLEDFQVQEFIENNFGAKVDKNIVSLFIEKAGGNPLYTEQLGMYLLEKNLVENIEGVLSLKTQIHELPPDVYSIVAARFDRLPSEIKEITIIASVVGQEFEKYLLDEMKKNAIKGAAEYFDGLAPQSFVDLSTSYAIELNINEKIWNTRSPSVFAFVHSIYRETIYNMHLKRKVRILHSYLGDILVELFNEDNSKYSDIAYQYEMAEKYDLSIFYYKKAYDFSMKKIKLDRAVSYGEKIVSLCDMYYSENSEKRCVSYFDFGICLMETGEYDKALEFLNKVLTFLNKYKNAKEIDDSKTLKYIGNIYLHKGEYDKAYAFYEESLKLKEGTEENSDVAEVYSSMGEIFCKKAEYEKAESYTKKALEIKKTVFGEKNSTVADSLDSLGLVFQNKGNYEAALECYQKGLKIRTELFGEDYYDAAYSYNNLGCFYSETGEYKTSFEYFKKAVKISENFLGEKHPVVASLYNNIGGCCINTGEITDAQYFLEKSLSIRLAIIGENHPDTAICRSNLGHVYYMLEDLDLSLVYYEKALKTMEMFYGEKHPFIAVILANIGKSLEKKEDLEKALECNKKSLEININNFGEDHISVAKNYGGIARVLFRSENWIESIDCCEKAINIIEKNINKAHPQLIEYCRIASECYKNLGKMDESEIYYTKMIGIEELVKKGNNSLKK